MHQVAFYKKGTIVYFIEKNKVEKRTVVDVIIRMTDKPEISYDLEGGRFKIRVSSEEITDDLAKLKQTICNQIDSMMPAKQENGSTTGEENTA